MYELTKGVWLQVVFRNPPKETEYDKILLEYEEMFDFKSRKGSCWSILAAQKIESENYPTDKWGVLLLRVD